MSLLEGAPSLRAWTSRLRLWHYPAFGTYRSWTIYRRGGITEKALVRRVVWNRPHDVERLCMPFVGLAHGFKTIPTIACRDADLNVTELEPRLGTLSKIDITPFTAQPIVTDGEAFGISNQSRISLEWPCDGPVSWRALAQWHASALVWLECCIGP